MNNVRKCCVFYNHISSWAPTTRWGGGGGEVGAHCFGGYFLHVRDYFSPCVESFSGMSSLTKIAASAHAMVARIVASVAHSGNLREIARLNLLIHFRAHFHGMLRKPMK